MVSKITEILRCERGDVLMEYVIINVLVVLPLLGVANGLFNPEGAMFNFGGTVTGDDYGILGNAWFTAVQRILSGIALPIP